MNIELPLTRNVLFEKHNLKIKQSMFFDELEQNLIIFDETFDIRRKSTVKSKRKK